MKIISVVGARPNFMKIAPITRALEQRGEAHVEHLLVHTGQHYDEKMSGSFFAELGIPSPDINLGIGSGSHAEQVGQTMIAFERVLREQRPDWVVVVGDVNATCACGITARKEGVNLAHIESGLRSRDMAMPEEINRLVTDRLSNLLFTTDEIANSNLRHEGVEDETVFMVGNVMIDTLEYARPTAAKMDLQKLVSENALTSQPLTFGGQGFAVVTMHRPSNVDDGQVLRSIVEFLVNDVTVHMPIVWPVHPRTKSRLDSFGLWNQLESCPQIVMLSPVSYHSMLKLNLEASLMMTDSGGLQEECCVLGTPCLTLRWNTERPITLAEHGGCSVLVGNDVDRIRQAFDQLRCSSRLPSRPPNWDGRSGERIVEILCRQAPQH